MIVCKQKQKKERIYGLDFLRAIAALGIIAHHFSGELKLRDVKMNHWLFHSLSILMNRVYYPAFSSL